MVANASQRRALILAAAAFCFFFCVMPFAGTRHLLGDIELREQLAATTASKRPVRLDDPLPIGQHVLLEHSYIQQSAEYLEYTSKLMQSTTHDAVLSLQSIPGRTEMQLLPEAFYTGNVSSKTAVRGSGYSATTRYWLHRACLPTASLVPFMGAPTAPPEARRRVMVVCGMHARELITSDFCRLWMLQAAAAHARITASNDGTCHDDALPGRSIAPIDWLIVPVSNEQGRNLVTRARKEWQFDDGSTTTETTREQGNMCFRGNLFGVDLNRNWPTPTPRPVTYQIGHEEYPGPSALSEPETVNLHKLISAFQPDVLLAVHSGEYAILTPYDDGQQEDSPVPRGLLLKVANWMAALSKCKTIKCLVGTGGTQLGLSYGTMGDFAYRNGLALFPFTLEIYAGNTSGARKDAPPDECFDFFNPLNVGAAVQRWSGLWRGWYYMSERDQTYLQQMITQMINAV